MPPSPLLAKVLFGSPIELSLLCIKLKPRNLNMPRPLPTMIPTELQDWWNQAMVKTRCVRNWVSLDCYHSWYTIVCGGSWYQGLLELRKYNPWSVRERPWDGFWPQNSRDLNCEQNETDPCEICMTSDPTMIHTIFGLYTIWYIHYFKIQTFTLIPVNLFIALLLPLSITVMLLNARTIFMQHRIIKLKFTIEF